MAIQPRTRAHLDTFAFWNANHANYVLDWFSRKQTAVSRSTTEAELCAAGHGATEGIWERLVLTELKMIQPSRLTIPITIQTDSQSAKALLKGAATRVDYAMWQYNFVRDPYGVGLVEFEWIRSKINLLTCWVSQVLHSTQ